MVKTQIQPLVDQMNKLYDRKHKVIRAVTSSCEAAEPEDESQDMPLAKFMQMVMEVGGQDLHDAIKECNPDLPDDWCLPGQSRFIRRDKSEGSDESEV